MSLGGQHTGESLIELLQRSTAPALRTRLHGHIRKQLEQPWLWASWSAPALSMDSANGKNASSVLRGKEQLNQHIGVDDNGQ
jgi:hypothetical protein